MCPLSRLRFRRQSSEPSLKFVTLNSLEPWPACKSSSLSIMNLPTILCTSLPPMLMDVCTSGSPENVNLLLLLPHRTNLIFWQPTSSDHVLNLNLRCLFSCKKCILRILKTKTMIRLFCLLFIPLSQIKDMILLISWNFASLLHFYKIYKKEERQKCIFHCASNFVDKKAILRGEMVASKIGNEVC